MTNEPHFSASLGSLEENESLVEESDVEMSSSNLQADSREVPVLELQEANHGGSDNYGRETWHLASELNDFGYKPLHLAVLTESLETVKMHLEQLETNQIEKAIECRDRFDRTPLHLAAKENNSDILEYLLQMGADATAQDKSRRSPLHLAAHNRALDTLKILVKHLETMQIAKPLECRDHYGRTPLHLAAKRNHTEAVEDLLKMGAIATARDDYGRQPHHLAALKNAKDALEILLNLETREIECRDHYGRTPLHLAAKENNSDVLKYLLQIGANAKAQDNYRRQPHHLAAKNKAKDALKILLQFVDINSVDYWKHTAFYLAKFYKHEEIKTFLLDNGADPTAGKQTD